MIEKNCRKTDIPLVIFLGSAKLFLSGKSAIKQIPDKQKPKEKSYEQKHKNRIGHCQD